MVRLADLPDYEVEHLLAKLLPPLGPPVWTPLAKPASQLRVALITTAGLHFRDDPPFRFSDASYRVIAGDEDARHLVMSHSSVNFDKSGFMEDVNLVFPIDRFRELERDSRIGSLAKFHYSFMGAGLKPHDYETSASQVAELLKKDRVDAVFLTPV